MTHVLTLEPGAFSSLWDGRPYPVILSGSPGPAPGDRFYAHEHPGGRMLGGSVRSVVREGCPPGSVLAYLDATERYPQP